MNSVLRLGTLLALFWVMGLSLGYPTLNRYQPSAPALADANYYAEMVERGISEIRDVGHWRYRVLVPALARPVFLAVKGHTGSWDPRFLALLVVNAGFCAITALTLASLGESVLGDRRLGVMAGLMFLLNFNTANFYLSGLVDSAEVCLLTLVLAALHYRRWTLLPLLGLLGGAAKETFVAFSGLVAGGWWLAGLRTEGLQWRRTGLMAAMGLAGLAAVVGLWSGLSGYFRLPAGIGASPPGGNTLGGILAEIPAMFINRSFWYTFAWLLPLGAAGFSRLPREWRWTAGLCLFGGLTMCAVGHVGDNLGRPLFSAVGPILIIAAAGGLGLLLGERRDGAGR